MHFALKILTFYKQIRKLISQKCLTGMNCDFQDTVLPKYSKCQEKVVLGIWKCLSVSAFPVATKWYLETTGGCFLIGLIIISGCAGQVWACSIPGPSFQQERWKETFVDLLVILLESPSSRLTQQQQKK